MTIVVLLGACGGNAGGELALSALGAEGRQITRTNGCASCHGSNGQGGVGPAFVGLFGADVELDDGTVVVADEEYLRRSIIDPGSQKVAGYRLPMPSNDLSDDEIDRVIAYITELAEPAGAAAGIELSSIASEGRALSRSSGCASCHGSDGQGGSAGPFVGLLGTEIELEDGTTVVADEAYIRTAITDPDAQRPVGSSPMPASNLSDTEIDRIVAYIVELGGAPAT